MICLDTVSPTSTQHRTAARTALARQGAMRCPSARCGIWVDGLSPDSPSLPGLFALTPAARRDSGDAVGGRWHSGASWNWRISGNTRRQADSAVAEVAAQGTWNM
eukprot:gene10208-biopygen1644